MKPQNTSWAIADVLFGRYNPAGRLPLTFYRSVRQLPPFDDYKLARGRTYMFMRNKPLYPFCHGLSYTAFKYANLRVSPQQLNADQPLSVSVEIHNTGARDGEEVVKFYVRNPNAPDPREIRALKAFRRVKLRRGTKKPVAAQIALRNLAFFSEAERRSVLEPGTLIVEAGSSSADMRSRTTLKVAARLAFEP